MAVLLALFLSLISAAESSSAPAAAPTVSPAAAAALMAAQSASTATPAPSTAPAPTDSGASSGAVDKLRSSPFCDSHALNEALASVDYRDAKVGKIELQLNGFGRAFRDDQPQAYRVNFTDPTGKYLDPVLVICSRKVQ